jgi:hypothetical protein
MAWRGTNSIRRFDAQDDHSAQLLLTHSDRTTSSISAMTRQTDRTGRAQSSRHCDPGREVALAVVKAATRRMNGSVAAGSGWIRLSVGASRHGRWHVFKRVRFAHGCSDTVTGSSRMLTSLLARVSAGMG